MENEVITLVNNILNEKFEIPMDQLTPEAQLKNDLNLDSLDFVDMIVLIEEKYTLSVKDIDILKIKTLGDIYELLSNLQKPTSDSQAELDPKTQESPL